MATNGKLLRRTTIEVYESPDEFEFDEEETEAQDEFDAADVEDGPTVAALAATKARRLTVDRRK